MRSHEHIGTIQIYGWILVTADEGRSRTEFFWCITSVAFHGLGGIPTWRYVCHQIIDNIGSRMDWKRDHVRALNQHTPCRRVRVAQRIAVANAVLAYSVEVWG